MEDDDHETSSETSEASSSSEENENEVDSPTPGAVKAEDSTPQREGPVESTKSNPTKEAVSSDESDEEESDSESSKEPKPKNVSKPENLTAVRSCPSDNDTSISQVDDYSNRTASYNLSKGNPVSLTPRSETPMEGTSFPSDASGPGTPVPPARTHRRRNNSDSLKRFETSEETTNDNQRGFIVESVYDDELVTTKISEGVPPSSRHGSVTSIAKETTFEDGKRNVDFILVWDETWPQAMDNDAIQKRKFFEQNLRAEGLNLECVPVEEDNPIHFIKIHTPREVLHRYAEILKFRMPMKAELCYTYRKAKGGSMFDSSAVDAAKKQAQQPGLREKFNGLYNSVFHKSIFFDKQLLPQKDDRFTAVYCRDKQYLFNSETEDFFNQSIRSRIVQFILDRTMFGVPSDNDPYLFGIERLIAQNVYSAAYPLHDGDLKTPGSMRNTLLNQWASPLIWYKYQPLDYIKEYLGVKIALYFTWLGFYTHMLFPAAVVGLLCFIYSCVTLKDDPPTQDICESHIDAVMCPHCDSFCKFWNLNETCVHAKVTYLFDNSMTIFFAVFMSIWAALFLEMWKRYSVVIAHRWDLTGWDAQEEQPRPQYLARIQSLKTQARPHYNIITGALEKRLPFWTIRLPATILSFSVVLLLIVLAIATVLGVILYRISILAALSVYGGNSIISSNAILFTSATSAFINLICIVLFNSVYAWLAKVLTEFEMLRTQSEFDDSYTLKMYLFQFVNYYASIFYIAFYKGKFIGYPADYKRVFGYRQEECGPGGCLMELCVQLGIIMVGKQIINTVLEIIQPLVQKIWNERQMKKYEKKYHHKNPRWVKDYNLLECDNQSLFPEYLEMVLQYGFVTIFVSAFPLAPFFALIKNIFEIRIDSYKLLAFHRRPVAQRVRNIGAWYTILDLTSKLAVVTNAFIIAFTSNFIPRLIYRTMVSENRSLEGFLNHSLSVMNTQDLDVSYSSESDVKYCWYPDYREPPWSPNKYDWTTHHWLVLTTRLIFVVLFENFVMLIVALLQWLIPDIPGHLKEQMRREAFITNEIIIFEEARRSSGDQKPRQKYNRFHSFNPETPYSSKGYEGETRKEAGNESPAGKRPSMKFLEVIEIEPLPQAGQEKAQSSRFPFKTIVDIDIEEKPKETAITHETALTPEPSRSSMKNLSIFDIDSKSREEAAYIQKSVSQSGSVESISPPKRPARGRSSMKNLVIIDIDDKPKGDELPPTHSDQDVHPKEVARSSMKNLVVIDIDDNMDKPKIPRRDAEV